MLFIPTVKESTSNKLHSMYIFLIFFFYEFIIGTTYNEQSSKKLLKNPKTNTSKLTIFFLKKKKKEKKHLAPHCFIGRPRREKSSGNATRKIGSGLQ
jgi:hypothetical protein